MKDKEKQKDALAKQGGVSIRFVGVCAIVAAILLAFYAFALAGYIANAEEALEEDEKRYVECNLAIDNLQIASDYLTSTSRMFVFTGRREYLDEYVKEFSITNRRGKSVDVLRSNFTKDRAAVSELEQALAASNGLAKSELAAMRLAADYYGIEDLPHEVATANTDLFRSVPDKDGKLDAAHNLILTENYDAVKNNISTKVRASANALLAQLDTDLSTNKNLMQSLLFQLRMAVALLLCVVMVFVLALFMYVLKPLSRYVERLNAGEPLEPEGAYELHYLANAYNNVYEDNTKRIEQLRQVAERDPLTGISNRSGYDNFLAKHTRNVALLLIDVDNFKEFNNVYGRDTGDEVLVKLAAALGSAFRSTDFPCRIEGDLFAVIMTNMSSELRHAIMEKVELVNSILAGDSSDLPAVTLSVGAAFSTEDMSDQEIFDAANSALRQAKQLHTNSISFYGESNTAEEL